MPFLVITHTYRAFRKYALKATVISQITRGLVFGHIQHIWLICHDNTDFH